MVKQSIFQEYTAMLGNVKCKIFKLHYEKEADDGYFNFGKLLQDL